MIGESLENAVLSVTDVTKSFSSQGRKVTALQGITLSVPAGKVTGLIGPDGAGKTTLMRLSACLLRPDGGRITVLGADAAADPLAVQAVIGYMPQRFGLYEDLSVRENLDLYADLQGLPGRFRADRYAELMKMTNLGPFMDRLAGRLSGGMKQKLGLACTLVRAPRLLLLDEPTVGVDPVSRRELWAIVSRLVERDGMSVFLSTAYLDEAERCDEVVLLNNGRILWIGPPEDFSREQTGRTFWVDAEGVSRRAIQMRLSGHPSVTDAVIQGDRVRVVADNAGPPDLSILMPEAVRSVLIPAPPRFEDSYVARLRSANPSVKGQPAPDGARPPDAPGRTDETVIRVEGLCRRFGEFDAVKDVSFDVRRGEIFGLLGANGAGKTTTFRMLCGLLPATGGKLSVAGLDLRKAAAKARARIGYMSQKFSLYGHLSVLQNLQFFSSAYNLHAGKRQERIHWALDAFGLIPLADAVSGDLSLGYKQRLALACALMHAPDILFLDEPTSGVDPMARREFWAHINRLACEGVTILVTTHFMEEAEYCDRLVIMTAGEVLAMGAPAEIKRRAASETLEEAFIALIENRGERPKAA